MNREYINCFLDANINVLNGNFNVEISAKEIYEKESTFKLNDIVLTIGLTGDLEGQVLISLDKKTALTLCGKLFPVNDLDEMVISCISEILGNQVMGNSSINLAQKDIKIDITPPNLLVGQSMISNVVKNNTTICIELEIQDVGYIDFNISLKK